MTIKSHEIHYPDKHQSAVVFASPHSGRDYPDDFVRRSDLALSVLRSSEDAFVDQLFADVPKFGAPLMCACAPRAWLDLNRASDELDPAIVAGAIRLHPNARISSGLGVIPRVVSGGRVIQSGRISYEEAQDRIDTVWRPYHQALRGMLQDVHARCGQVVLVDCHSMPPEALDGLDGPRPEIVLGDRYGMSAGGVIVGRIHAAFERAGFRVARNRPFAGAYIAERYGRPLRGQHCIQIEIDRSLYMDAPNRFEMGARFDAFRARLRPVIAEIAQIGQPRVGTVAAE